MKNRYIPFGYQIQNGDSVINTEQAATVQHIFYAYTEGQSFKEIAEYLTTSGTAYHFSDNSWNKNIVARILSVGSRAVGESGAASPLAAGRARSQISLCQIWTRPRNGQDHSLQNILFCAANLLKYQ